MSLRKIIVLLVVAIWKVQVFGQPPPPFGNQFPGGPFPGGQFPGGQFPGGQFPGGQFPGGQQPGGQFPGGQQPGGPANRCRIDGSSASLPSCMNKYFINGVLVDGNNNTCKTNKGVIAAKIDKNTLLSKALQVVQSGQCQGERGHKKRQMPSCGSGTGVGKCETSTSRLQSVYGEMDLGDKILIVTNGVPDHCYRDGMDQPIPNYVCEHYRALLVPKKAVKTNSFKTHPMGPVGIAKSGAFFYNHLSAEATCNAAAITEKQTFDTCDGHPDPGCRYHYHKAPNCIPGFKTCGLVGYSNDGVPVYGKCNIFVNGVSVPIKSCYKKIANKNGCDASHYQFDSATPGCNLDMANGYLFRQDTQTASGQSFKSGTYAYFFTPDYPFIMPGYYGDKSQVKWCVISV